MASTCARPRWQRVLVCGVACLAFIGSARLARSETGRDLWLRYRLIEDEALRTAGRRNASSITVPGRSPTSRIIASELQRGLRGLLGVDVPAAPAAAPTRRSTVVRRLDVLNRYLIPNVDVPWISPKLPHFDSREPARREQKRAIAQKAVELVEDGDTILLDGGSTTYEVARLLAGRPLHE